MRECAGIVVGVEGKTVGEIFGYPDDLKFHSSMTLFAEVGTLSADGSSGSVFRTALEKYFGGKKDKGTLERLASTK